MGSGALKHAHNLAHAQADAAAALHHEQAPADRDQTPDPLRHERECPLHVMLQGPLLAPAAADVVPGEAPVAGRTLGFVVEPSGSRLPARVDCRGPPIC